VDEAIDMKGGFADLLKIFLYGLPLLFLVGCCGQFFRGTKDVVAVSIGPANTTILPGGTQQFTATGTFAENGGTGDVTAQTRWTSSNPALVTITSAGLAKGIAVGTVTIGGDCDCYVTKTNLTVSSQAVTLASIVVTPMNPSVGTGQTQQFTATGHYSDGSTNVITSSVTWTSSSTEIATISSAGVATTVAAGNSTITASSGNISGTAILTVS
jgi:hypothetical protein